jgi:nucleoside 2-deoxyribosyltransferase
MRKRTVYLAGQISVKAPETYNWRERARNALLEDGESRFEVIDPTYNNFNGGALARGHETNFELYKEKSIGLIVPKDRNSVKHSDICIVNMNFYDETKPFIGTIFELAWYYDSPDKQVIGISEEEPGTTINTGHPFIQSAINVWTKDDQEAVELVKFFTESG